MLLRIIRVAEAGGRPLRSLAGESRDHPAVADQPTNRPDVRNAGAEGKNDRRTQAKARPQRRPATIRPSRWRYKVTLFERVSLELAGLCLFYSPLSIFL